MGRLSLGLVFAQPPDHSKDEAQVAGAGAGTANDAPVFRGVRDVAGLLLGDFFCLKLSSQNGTNINQYFGVKPIVW